MKRLLIGFLMVATIGSITMTAVAGDDQYRLNDVGRSTLGGCESGNDPTSRTFYTRDENSYGKYHFEQPTWIAALSAMADAGYLGGYDWNKHTHHLPHEVEEAVQDHVATFWFGIYGPQPWSWGNNCGGQAVAAMAASENKSNVIPTITGQSPVVEGEPMPGLTHTG